MANIDDQDIESDRFQNQRNEVRRERADRRTLRTAAALPEDEQIAILEEQANRERIRQDDLARARSGTPYVNEEDHEKDETDFGARNRRDRNHISFGTDEPYPFLGGRGEPKEHVVESRRAGRLYSSATKILEDGLGSRSRDAIFGAFKKHETFQLTEIHPDKGYSFRRTSKVESRPFRTREVKYREDGKTKARVTLTYHSYIMGSRQERYDYDADGKKFLTGFKTSARSWFVDKEPGGLVTRTSRRELGGIHASIRRSWSSTDENGKVTTHSALVHRGVGPYSMSWSQKTNRDREGNESHEHVKTETVGKGGWLFKRDAQYNLETGKKTVTTKYLGIFSGQPRSQPMTDVEKAKVTKREQLRETSVQSSIDAKGQIRDLALQREQRIRMVEAATIYRLPQPGTVRRLQNMVRTVQPERPDFDRARDHLSREQYRAVSAWVNSGGDVAYAQALAAEKERAAARGKTGPASDHSSDSGLSGSSQDTFRAAGQRVPRRAGKDDYGSSSSDSSSETGSNSSRSSSDTAVDRVAEKGSWRERTSRKVSERRARDNYSTDGSDTSFDSESSTNSSNSDGSNPSGTRYRAKSRDDRSSTGAKRGSDGWDTSSESSFDSKSSHSSSSASSLDDFVSATSGKEEREPLLRDEDDPRSRNIRSRARGGDSRSI